MYVGSEGERHGWIAARGVCCSVLDGVKHGDMLFIHSFLYSFIHSFCVSHCLVKCVRMCDMSVSRFTHVSRPVSSFTHISRPFSLLVRCCAGGR